MVRAERERLEATCQISRLDEFLGEKGKGQPRILLSAMTLLTLFNQTARDAALPEVTLKAFLLFGDPTQEGALVKAVALPWYAILERIRADPAAAFEINSRAWEEIVAGAYEKAGFDEVILTPPSGDKGRDVVATKKGIGSIRIFDQVKAYKPGHVVTAEEVRALLGVITGGANVSKGVMTTTSAFAPRLAEDEYLKPYIPYRLELKPRDVLLAWLDELSATAEPPAS